MIYLAILGATEILCSFRLVLEEKTGTQIPKSSRLRFLEKFLANNFALLDAEDSTSGLFNRGSIVELPLLEILLAEDNAFGPLIKGDNRQLYYLQIFQRFY